MIQAFHVVLIFIFCAAGARASERDDGLLCYYDV